MNAVIYARYSSDNQREESIEGQLRECKEYAGKNGITVLGSYIDRALSAKTDNRPEFQRMVKDSGKGMFEMVLVWKLDRFARNRFDSAHYKMLLRKNGVRVVSAKETISDGPEGIILESMLEGYAEYYSAELAQKVNRGLHENALKCRNNGGGVPFGFRLGLEQKLVADPETAPIVVEIYQRYAAGELAKEIIDDLNRRGLRNNYGKQFCKSYLHRLLINRKYLGEYRYKDVVIPGGLPALVPQALFDEVQVRMNKNKQAPARAKAKCEYLLSGKLICGDCGRLMVGESGTSRKGVTHNYYKCAGAKQKLGCHRKSLRKRWIEDAVIYYTVRDVLTEGRIQALARALATLQEQEDTTLPALRRQLADTEKGIENMVNAIQQGIFTPSTKERLDELEARREELKVSILQAEMARPAYTEEEIALWLHHFKGGDTGDTDYRRKLIDTFINAVYSYEDHIVIVYNFHDGSRMVTQEEINRVLDSDLQSLGAPNEEPYKGL